MWIRRIPKLGEIYMKKIRLRKIERMVSRDAMGGIPIQHLTPELIRENYEYYKEIAEINQ